MYQQTNRLGKFFSLIFQSYMYVWHIHLLLLSLIFQSLIGCMCRGLGMVCGR
jgi:hypothetical protein